jgi:hypothetical protein
VENATAANAVKYGNELPANALVARSTSKARSVARRATPKRAGTLAEILVESVPGISMPSLSR